MTPGEGKKFRAVCLNLSLALHSGLDYFMGLSVDDLVDTAREAADIIGRHK